VLRKINEETVDILVLGAGPAGCAAAICAARAGWRVMVLERALFPRHRPGETLHPGVEPILRQLGVAAAVEAAGFLRHPGFWVQWGTESLRFEAYGHDQNGSWHGYQANRAVLDTLLLQAACKAGVQLRQPCRAQALLRTPQGWVAGVRTDQGDILASVVIDATGRRQWAAGQLGLPVKQCSSPLTAYYGYLHQFQSPLTAPALTTDLEGWRWIAPISQTQLAWVRLSLRKSGIRPTLAECLGAGVSPADSISVGTPVRAEDVTWKLVDGTAGPGYVLAGDAAAILDPAAGHGVLKALMSGMAAQTATQMIQRPCANHASASYNNWFARWHEHDVAHLRKWYSQLSEAGLGSLSNDSR
jgi:flavin-dependent dehydrogenase